MKKLLKNLFLFSIPFLLCAIIVVLIDPFDYFELSLFKDNQIKTDIARKVDSHRRYKLINYKKNPKDNVILGASQTIRILEENIPSDNWANLAQGGASMDDKIATFWHVMEHHKVDTVFFALDPFNYANSSGRSVHSVTQTALELIDNPLLYFFDKYVLEATVSFAGSFFKDTVIVNENPDATRDDFWATQLVKVKNRMTTPIMSSTLREELQAIKSYCDKNNIVIVAFVPIAHSDLFYIEEDFLKSYFFPEIVNIFGTVYDFHYPNSFTSNRDNFGDPFHAVGDSIYINTFWKQDTTLCHIITKENINQYY